MWADTVFLQQYQRAYNNLPDINVAFGKFETLEQSFAVVEGALRIIAAHDARDFLGVFLLHRHFAAPDGKIFVERRARVSGRSVFVTEPESPRKSSRDVAPYRYVLGAKGELQPIEFSGAPSSLALHRKLERAEPLRKAISAHLGRAGAARLLGVGTFDRKRLEVHRILLEETAQSKSIVRQLTKFPGKLAAIPTFWTHFPPPPTGASKSRVAPRKSSGESYGRKVQALLPEPLAGRAIRAASSGNGCCSVYCVGTDDNGSGQCSHGGEHIGCA